MEETKSMKPGTVLERWGVYSLGELCNIVTGKKDVNEGNPTGSYPFFTCSKKTTFSDEYSFDTEAILVAGNGEVGLTKYYKGKFEAYQRTYVLKDFTHQAKYIFYYLLCGLKNKLRKDKTGSTMPYIKMGDLSNFQVYVPKSPIEEEKIVYVISKVQYAIEIQEKIIQTTIALKKALMQKLFTEGLKGEAQKETEIGRIPKSWSVIPLEQTGEVVYGIQAAVANLTKPIGTKILTNVNITFDGEITLEKLRYFPLTKPKHHKTVLHKGDILFNWRSGSKDHVGKTAFFDLDGDFTHASFILRIRTKKEVLNKYLFYYLTYLRSSGYFYKLQNYSVNAKFNASAVNALPTALPDYSEQLEIAHTLTVVDLKIKNQTEKLKLLTSLFHSILYGLMTGQATVKDITFS